MNSEHQREYDIRPEEHQGVLFDDADQGISDRASLFPDSIEILRSLIDEEPLDLRRQRLHEALESVEADHTKSEKLLSRLSEIIADKNLKISELKFKASE